jgi:peptidyl-prolyl cis-trans isomerase C
MSQETWKQFITASMRTPVKCLLVIIGLFMLLSTMGGECYAAPKAPREVLARWGQKVITKQDMEARIASLPMEYQMRVQTEEQRQEFLEALLQMEILATEAKAQKLEKDKDVAVRIADTVNSILAQEYMKKKMATLKKPTDKEVEEYYQSHKDQYVQPAQIKAQHILIQTAPDAKPEELAAAKAKAEGIHKELLAGGDFAKLAEKYSDDKGSKVRGGDLGFFSRENMIPEFAEEAFKLKKDEISQPVKTGYGFHIIKVNEINPQKQMDLQEAAGAIQTSLENARREELASKEMERLKKKYNAKITVPPETKK